MTALAVLIQKDIPHGDIRVAFTPDEEVGKGAKHFDVAAFDAKWAYTVDGGGVGELEFENFNAASVNIQNCRQQCASRYRKRGDGECAVAGGAYSR